MPASPASSPRRSPPQPERTRPSGAAAAARASRNGRALSDRPGAVRLHHLPVDVQLAACTQVLDDVPVNRARVLAPGECVRAAEREVDRPVDLLVEGDVLHEAADAGVAADPELADPPRSGVGLERTQQELLAGARRRVDDPAALE